MALKFLNNGYFAGKVGIGVEAPLTNLDILGTSDTYLTIRSNGGGLKSGIRMYGGTAGVSNIWHDDNETNPPGIHFGTSANIATAPTTQLYIKGSDGNVGIGTTTPSAKLDVRSSVTGNLLSRVYNPNTGTSSSAAFRIASSANNANSASLQFSDSAAYTATISGDRVQGLVFRTSASGNNPITIPERMRITPTGNVGIGTTSPQAALHVAGPLNTTAPTGNGVLMGLYNGTHGHIQLNGDWGGYIDFSTSGTDRKGRLLYDNTSNYMLFETASTEKMRIDSAGNVGIGTTSPNYKLSVDDNSVTSTPKTVLQFDSSQIDDGGGYDIDFRTSSNDLADRFVSRIRGIREGAGAKSQLSFWTDDGSSLGQRMTINSAGNVGIGIAAPTSKLHINQNVTDPTLDLPSSFAVEIDSNHSGTTATGGDREQGGLYIDVDSSTTGGDITDEHRVYGVYSDVKHSGDADRATGVYAVAEQNTTAGATSFVLGGEFLGVTDGGGSATLNTVAGVLGSVSIQDATPVVNSYGGYFRNSQSTTRTGSTTSTYGLYAEVELNSDTAYTNIYGQRITLDVNTSGFTASRITLLDFSVTGLTDIPSATATYAIHQPNDIKSYHEGSFGIGSTNPTNGKLVIDSTANQIAIETGTAGDGRLNIGHFSNGTFIGTYGDDGGAADVIRFGTHSGDERMRIASNGDVGIGTTSPSQRLVIGSAQGNGIQFLYDTTDSYRNQIKNYWNSSADTRMDFNIGRVAGGVPTTVMSVGYNSNVGIGTTSPTSKLSIEGNAYLRDNLAVTVTDPGTNLSKDSEIYLQSKGNQSGTVRSSQWRLQTESDSVWGNSGFSISKGYDGGSAAEYVRITSGGNVGINTTLPGFKLDVDGTFGVSDLPFNTDSVSVLVADETIGPELITNGEFATATDWTLQNAGSTISGGKLNQVSVPNGQNVYQTTGIVVGNTYKVVMTISGYSSGGVRALLGSTGYTTTRSANGTFSVEGVAAGNTTFYIQASGTTTLSIDNVSVKQVASASNQIQKRELGTGAFGPTPVGAYLPLAGGTMTGTGSIVMPDNFRLQLGNGIFSIFNDGTYSIIRSANKPLLIDSNGITFRGYSPYDTLATITSSGVSVKSALLSNQENTDVDTGTETIANVAIATYTAAFFDFVVKNGTNVRSGTVYACHDGTNVEFTETSTNDLGDTSDVTLSVDISGGNMRLLATTTSDNWSVKSLIRAI